MTDERMQKQVLQYNRKDFEIKKDIERADLIRAASGISCPVVIPYTTNSRRKFYFKYKSVSKVARR
jgi:hypothetical protein